MPNKVKQAHAVRKEKHARQKPELVPRHPDRVGTGMYNFISELRRAPQALPLFCTFSPMARNLVEDNFVEAMALLDAVAEAQAAVDLSPTESALHQLREAKEKRQALVKGYFDADKYGCLLLHHMRQAGALEYCIAGLTCSCGPTENGSRCVPDKCCCKIAGASCDEGSCGCMGQCG